MQIKMTLVAGAVSLLTGCAQLGPTKVEIESAEYLMCRTEHAALVIAEAHANRGIAGAGNAYEVFRRSNVCWSVTTSLNVSGRIKTFQGDAGRAMVFKAMAMGLEVYLPVPDLSASKHEKCPENADCI